METYDRENYPSNFQWALKLHNAIGLALILIAY